MLKSRYILGRMLRAHHHNIILRGSIAHLPARAREGTIQFGSGACKFALLGVQIVELLLILISERTHEWNAAYTSLVPILEKLSP